jgi:hypothetical protein
MMKKIQDMMMKGEEDLDIMFINCRGDYAVVKNDHIGYRY